ncbi:MAG: hypothetical protein AB1393_13040 [Candidatus Edwardsbacteria bacterium]
MKLYSPIALALGVILAVFGLITIVPTGNLAGIIPLIIGLSLMFLGWKGGRTATILFGHICIMVGCFLITLGMYLLPYCKPTLLHIFTRPLFWGLFSLMGGVCAIYHGFCQCVRRQK